LKSFSFLLLFFVSCSHFQRGKIDAPSWVQGIRSGDESLRVVNGNKLLYRRILKNSNDPADVVCAKALDLVSNDLKNEFLVETKVPYTLEYLHYDEAYKDCAVTISISTQISTRLAEIKEINKNHAKIKANLESEWNKAEREKVALESKNSALSRFILENSALLERYHHQVSEIQKARTMLNERKNRSIASAFTGLGVDEFQKLISHDFSISSDYDSRCYAYYRQPYLSYHGTAIVCWSSRFEKEAHIVGYCETDTGYCFKRNP
jgi:hypothetical protein